MVNSLIVKHIFCLTFDLIKTMYAHDIIKKVQIFNIVMDNIKDHFYV